MEKEPLNTLRTEDWTSLVSAVERGNCTLMLGRDAIVGTFDGEERPVHVGLARFVKSKLVARHPRYESLDPADPSAVAQVAILEEDPAVLQEWVREFYGSFTGPSRTLSLLAELPFDLVVNTSPGLSVDRAFREVKPATSVDFYDHTAPAHSSFPDPTPIAPLIYHLYGSLDRPASLILSDNDRLDFLVSVISGDPPLPVKLRSILADRSRSFLFLGFGLGQWQLRVLLHVLSKDVRRQLKSVALERLPAQVDESTKLFYKSGHKITFFDTDVEEFASELHRRVTPASAAVADAAAAVQPNGIPADAPLLFLCHANADKDFVERLAVDLRNAGIRTWFDKENLRGGDRWDALIQETIQLVDYFVVIQSSNLREREVGYVNLEIVKAMQRQQMYRPPRSFVIPTIIDNEDSRLAAFDGLQCVDLSGPAGTVDLLRAIRRDLNATDTRR